jgi:hypothetical protein
LKKVDLSIEALVMDDQVELIQISLFSPFIVFLSLTASQIFEGVFQA